MTFLLAQEITLEEVLSRPIPHKLQLASVLYRIVLAWVETTWSRWLNSLLSVGFIGRQGNWHWGNDGFAEKLSTKFAWREGMRNSLVSLALVLNLRKFHTNLCFCSHKIDMRVKFQENIIFVVKIPLGMCFP